MIRKLKFEEIPVVARYYEKEMAQNFRDVGEEPISEKKYVQILKKNIKKSKMFVLDKNGIKGFAWFVKEDNEINIEELFVIEKGEGYGKQLINFILEFAKKNKIKKINLEVHVKNEKGMAFFKRFGFTKRTVELSLDLD